MSSVGESERVNVSSVQRLRSLPRLFRGADLTVRFGWQSKTASHYLWLWKRAGLVARPSAVIFGVECLRRAGWTTQIPMRPDVAIDASLPRMTAEPFTVVRRSDAWFSATQRGLHSRTAGMGAATAGLPMLRPAWALADMLSSADWGECGLFPDDVDVAEATERDRVDWRKAVQALGVPVNRVAALPGLAQPLS
jgi:hypothetical protein